MASARRLPSGRWELLVSIGRVPYNRWLQFAMPLVLILAVIIVIALSISA